MNKGLFLLGGKKKHSKKIKKNSKRRISRRKSYSKRRKVGMPLSKRTKIGMPSLKTSVLRSEALYKKFNTLLEMGDYEGFKKLTLMLPQDISLNDIYLLDEYGIKTFLHDKQRPFNDPYGRSLIFIAVEQQDIVFLNKLLNSHFRADIIDYAYRYKVDDKILSGLDPLILACYHGNSQIVEMLLSKMVDRNIIDTETQTMNPIQRPSKGWTPLIAAADGGHLEVAQMLLQRGVDVDKTSKDIKFTPLHYAVNNGHVDMVKLLIDNNANLNIQTLVFRETPLHIAMEKNNQEIIEVLINAGANTNIPDLYNKTYAN